MTQELVTVTPNTPAGRVLELMIERNISHVPVIDQDRRLLGLITGHQIREIELGRQSASRTAREIMLSDPVSITADATLGGALRVMHAQRVSSLPVVDAGGRVEGIITRQDLLSLMCRMLALDHEGSSVELALHEEKTDLVAAFEVLNSLKTEVLSAVASLVRDDGDEPALYLRIAQRNPRPVESALARAGLILLEPEMEAERLDSAEQPVK